MTLKTTTFCLDSYTLSKETGFYYLQSRYYDPIIKRFLNADSYGSTGQGFLGYNMFAYCGNNPTNMSDPSGDISFWVLIRKFVLDWGLAHFLVQTDIKKKHDAVEIEVYVDRGHKKGGRMDVYLKGNVWEVKHVASGASAFPQACSYLYCKVSGRNEYVKDLGAAGAFQGTIKINLMGYSYRIDYNTPNAGVILYSVNEDHPDNQHQHEYVPVANRRLQESNDDKSRVLTHAALALAGTAVACGFCSFGSNPLGGMFLWSTQPA